MSGEEILAGDGRKLRVLDLMPIEEDDSPFVGLLKVEPAQNVGSQAVTFPIVSDTERRSVPCFVLSIRVAVIASASFVPAAKRPKSLPRQRRRRYRKTAPQLPPAWSGLERSTAEVQRVLKDAETRCVSGFAAIR